MATQANGNTVTSVSITLPSGQIITRVVTLDVVDNKVTHSNDIPQQKL